MPNIGGSSSRSGMPAVLADASALIALLDGDDASHASCVEALRHIRGPLATVWPALSEAMHLLAGTPRGPEALSDMIADGALDLLALEAADFPRIKELMRKYRDLPMDFADAALVRAAERHRLTTILTFDAHFEIYRFSRRTRFVVLPSKSS